MTAPCPVTPLHDRGLLSVRQLGQSYRDGRTLFLPQGLFLWAGRSAEIHEAMQVITAPGVFPSKRPCEITGGDNGVGGKPIVGYPRSCLDKTGEGLLGEVFDYVGIANSGS